MSSSRVKFVNELFRISKDPKNTSSIDRYRAMGQQCKLADYLNGHATNYLYHGNKNKPVLNEIDENLFVALNVEAPAIEAGDSPIVPFFSIKIGDNIDSVELREKVLNISQDAADDEFLTCPDFMNGNNGQGIILEKVLFKVSIENDDISSISIPKSSAFDEEKTESFNKNISSVISFLSKFKSKSFLHSWCKPFMHNNQTLFCNVRAVDRDQELVSHSIFVAIFNSEDMLKQCVAAYGEDAMNIIAIVKSIFINDTHKKQLLESIKSAVSAIMSRNMSHNLGSHYLYYTKAHLDKVSYEFLNYGDETGKFAPDIRGAAKVLGYVQGRMDYLATVISQDKYPYGSVNFKTHIWDELTIDDFSSRHFGDPSERNKRTTNYLLSNLVMSENFTRPDVREGGCSPDRYLLFLNARYTRTKNSNNEDIYVKFTGTLQNKKVEDAVKKDLSQLYLALPGGTMSCHAFFNVIENFIRNSAKYLQSDFKSGRRKDGDVISAVPFLNFTIAIRRNPSDNNLLDFIIFDNKQNANRIVNEKKQVTLYNNIVYNVLGELRIIDDSGHIEKEAKGFKEMLFSALWMHAYNFGNKTFADIISEINDIDVRSEKDQEKKESLRRDKIKLIENYAFRVVQVIDNEKLSTLTILDREELPTYTNKDLDKASLGIIVTIPEFKQEGSFCPILSNPEKTKQELMKTYADIVTVPAEYEFYESNKEFTGLFPRPYSGISDISLNDKFKTLLRRRFAGFDDYCLDFDSGPMGPESTDLSHRVYFKRHLSTKDKDCLMNKYRNYAYADTISGGNFTITIEQLCKEGWNGSSFDKQSEFFALKVIESALTRITIIDERLYNSNALGHEDELSLKNIRVLNYNTFEDKLSDVLNNCRFVLYKGVQDKKIGKNKLEKIKRTLKDALEEAYCSVKHIQEITEEMQDISQSVDWLVDYVENKLRNSIDSFSKDISGCQELAGDELRTQSYNNLIINYVETLSSSELEKSTALRKLIAPVVEKIRDKIVQEVNSFADGDMSCILQGNVFRDMKDDSLFLSIHLGLVEKILKNSEWVNYEITRRLSLLNTGDSQKKKDLEVYDRLSDDRVAIFMEMLHEKFASTDTTGQRKELFISIHSGRGNFSRELERSLKRYPFITLSALENAFNNCKYLLSQVFYNTIYLGKGVANE